MFRAHSRTSDDEDVDTGVNDRLCKLRRLGRGQRCSNRDTTGSDLRDSGSDQIFTNRSAVDLLKP